MRYFDRKYSMRYKKDIVKIADVMKDKNSCKYFDPSHFFC